MHTTTTTAKKIELGTTRCRHIICSSFSTIFSCWNFEIKSIKGKMWRARARTSLFWMIAWRIFFAANNWYYVNRICHCIMWNIITMSTANQRRPLNNSQVLATFVLEEMIGSFVRFFCWFLKFCTNACRVIEKLSWGKFFSHGYCRRHCGLLIKCVIIWN